MDFFEDTNWFFLWKLSTYTILFLFGGALASFYATLADRILYYCYEKGRKEFKGLNRWRVIFTKPSHCPECKTPITKLYLVPILGWFLTKGKCTHCHTKVPKLYPLSEFLFGIIAVVVYSISSSLLGTICLLFLFGHLLISMMTDAKKLSLDYENLPFLLGFGFLSNSLLFGESIGQEHLVVYFGFLVFYLVIYLLFRGGTGLGDVLFSPVFATLAGNPFWIVYLNTSYLLAVMFSLFLRKKGEPLKGMKVPMGLYFSIGLFFTFFCKLIVHNYEWEGFSDLWNQ
ncbi:prepilin peptidase [Leptospira levettii]|uniref:Prepilin peptidase n=1 Tax=Leptospira levettii TaxID=2023178 RepID=A0AAW5V397_9LEPT|nr:A24 family peptidase [Leptospira levettii]MCW7464104.1 prepilin peptidase [Leptospira levettii]MCW7511710.1 prepilin peptidase [Leptospira levettii]MCW7515467.1 prepilin peptidase [Leptospira levettii]TGM32862.1 prepilin peptidase [Leptospira levettii]